MKVTYTGRQEPLAPAQKRKLDAKLAKLGKLLDRRDSEREAHVILTSERHLRRAEITVNVYDHPMVGVADSADSFTALCEAIDRLEKQTLKLRSKKRDTKRESKSEWKTAEPPAAAEPAAEEPPARKVFRVEEHDYRKPMTIDEALLELDSKRDYFVFRDSETDRLAVVLRRRDGHVDLIEA
jgi:putative sigma-54 modulation protein